MNHSVVFLLVIVMCFEWNEACKLTRVLISNQLFYGLPLGIHCRDWTGKDYGIEILTSNSNRTFDFVDVAGKKRARYECDLWYKNKGHVYNFDKMEVYRAAKNKRCGEYRQWTATIDGIYTRRDIYKRLGFARKWNIKSA